MRALPALAGIATVALVYLAAERIGGRRAGWIAGGIAALNPLLVWYAQEARAYSLLAFFGALTFLLALRALERPRELWAWALAALLGLATALLRDPVRRARGAVADPAHAPRGAVADRRAGRRDGPAARARRRATFQRADRLDQRNGAPHAAGPDPQAVLHGPRARPPRRSLAVLAVLGVVALAAVLVRRRPELPEALLVAAGIAVGAPVVMAAARGRGAGHRADPQRAGGAADRLHRARCIAVDRRILDRAVAAAGAMRARRRRRDRSSVPDWRTAGKAVGATAPSSGRRPRTGRLCSGSTPRLATARAGTTADRACASPDTRPSRRGTPRRAAIGARARTRWPGLEVHQRTAPQRARRV